MREAPGDLAPGGIALCLQQCRDVVEHDDVAGRMVLVTGQRRARAGENSLADFAAQHDLLAPLRLARIEVHARHVDELVQQGIFPRHVDELLAAAMFEVDAEDRAGRLVGVANGQVGLERQHACREARQDDFEVGAFRLHERLAQGRLAARRRKSLRHVVERADQEPDFVTRRRRQARVEVAHGDGARAGDEVLDRRDEAPRQHERAIDGGEQAQQQHEGQRQRQQVLEVFAEEDQLLVLLVRALDALDHLGESIGDREIRLHRARFLDRAGPVHEGYGRTHLDIAVGQRLEADERAALLHLEHDFLGHRFGQ